MINESTKIQIQSIWDKYLASGRIINNTKGERIDHIDEKRSKAIEDIRLLIRDFNSNQSVLGDFKTTLDGYNKRNNFWGFPAAKGQMFFNQLVNSSKPSLEELSLLLKQSISEPKNPNEALDRIDKLEEYVKRIYDSANDKRLAPRPSSVGYFLSYFWQIHNPAKWPIIYSSLTNAFADLGIWKNEGSQREQYQEFYELNDEIKKIVTAYHGEAVSNWDVEHAFWIQAENPRKPIKTNVGASEISATPDSEEKVVITANLRLDEYLIPKFSNLVALGSQSEKSSSTKGRDFERVVGEVFKLMGFEIEVLGQGTGRNPDVIIKFSEQHTAFIVDAKAYTDGYSLGVDDRAIREYIGYHSPLLYKQGYRRIGFIVVCNSFKSDLNEFVNDLTWQTEIKRFILLTSEALLYLSAYKAKDNLSLGEIIRFLIHSSNPIKSQDVIEEFDDV